MLRHCQLTPVPPPALSPPKPSESRFGSLPMLAADPVFTSYGASEYWPDPRGSPSCVIIRTSNAPSSGSNQTRKICATFCPVELSGERTTLSVENTFSTARPRLTRAIAAIIPDLSPDLQHAIGGHCPCFSVRQLARACASMQCSRISNPLSLTLSTYPKWLNQ